MTDFYKTLCAIMFLTTFWKNAKGITNQNYKEKDSYLTAYEDSKYQNTGLVRPEPSRSYESEEYYPPPLHHYGHSDFHPPFHYGGFPEPLVPVYAPAPLYVPGLPLHHIPHKFSILTKIGLFFITIAKIILNVMVVKLIIKFFMIFAMFFIYPKLELLAVTEAAASEMMMMPTKTEDMPPSNKTEFSFRNDKPNLNDITHFVISSVTENQFLESNDCVLNKTKLSCKVQKTLATFNDYMSIPRLFNYFWNRSLKNT